MNCFGPSLPFRSRKSGGGSPDGELERGIAAALPRWVAIWLASHRALHFNGGGRPKPLPDPTLKLRPGNPQRAIPCGLILNESLSNALKYAFPNVRSGKIAIRFGRGATGELVMSCHDDGIRIPKGIDWRRWQSLGFRIIGIVAKQIGGNIDLVPGGVGTHFELRFPDAVPGRLMPEVLVFPEKNSRRRHCIGGRLRGMADYHFGHTPN